MSDAMDLDALRSSTKFVIMHGALPGPEGAPDE